MGHAAPVVGRGGELHADQLHALAHVPQAEIDREASVGRLAGLAVDQGRRPGGLPRLEARQHVHLDGLFRENSRVDRLEQARSLQIVGNHLGDVGADPAGAGEARNGDGQGFDRALIDVDLGLGARGRRCEGCGAGEKGEADCGEGGRQTHGRSLLQQGPNAQMSLIHCLAHACLASKVTIISRQPA